MALAVLAASAVRAQVDGGGDFRAQQVEFNNIPVSADPPGVARGGDNRYFRVRSRLWMKADDGDCTLYGRVVNEFFRYLKPEDTEDWEYPDEAIVDQLYLDANKLFGGSVDLRVGRQDLIYGAGRVLLEGTPKDTSRTIYCDAAKAVIHLGKASSIDLLGIYNRPENELAYHSQDRDLTGFDPAYNDLTESGGGVYVQIRDWQSLPAEVYYLAKNESDWERFIPPAAAGDAAAPPPDATVQGRLTHTVGARLTPALGSLTFDIEGAYEFGKEDDAAGADGRDVQGYMGFAGARWTLPTKIGKAAPYVGAACYYLSGDDPDTADKDEGWNPLWARYAQLSELYVYAYDFDKGGYWSNLLMPYVEAGIRFGPGHAVALLAGQLTAPEGKGPGGGDARGMLYTARYDFPLGSGVAGKTDAIGGHLLAEWLDPDDYYAVTDAAYFLRWELTYSF
jgi:hypothetical protein